MNIKNMIALGAVVLGLAAMPAAAVGHVTVSPEEGPSEGYAMLTFTVPHGCEAAATNSVQVKMPPQVISATPGVVAGWDIKTVEGKLPRPSEMHGEPVTEGVRQVTWSGGPLASDQLQQFPLSVAFSGEVGEKAEFKIVQNCVNGAETAWIQTTPASGVEPEHPAPFVTLEEADDHGSDDHAEQGAETASASDSESSDDGSSDGLAIAALVVGALGLITGSAALIRGRRK